MNEHVESARLEEKMTMKQDPEAARIQEMMSERFHHRGLSDSFQPHYT